MTIYNSATTGNSYGIVGESDSPSTGIGVIGHNLSTTGGIGVWGYAASQGVYGETGANNAQGVYGQATSTSAGATAQGVYGTSPAPSGYGVYGVATDNTLAGAASGVYGTSSSGQGGIAAGVYAQGTGSYTYGVYATSANYYGLYAYTGNASYCAIEGDAAASSDCGLYVFGTGQITNALGIGTTPSGTYLLNVAGSAQNNTGVWHTASDERLKKNIKQLNGSLEKLLQLRGVSFEWKEPEKHGARANDLQMGFVAQEVEPIFPQWVDTGEDGYRRVGTPGFQALTVEGFRELDTERRQLAAQVETLESRIKVLEKAQGIRTAGVGWDAWGRGAAPLQILLGAACVGLTLLVRRKGRRNGGA